MQLRHLLAGATVVAAIALVGAAADQMLRHDGRKAVSEAPAQPIDAAISPTRTPRIANDMSATFRNLERMGLEKPTPVTTTPPAPPARPIAPSAAEPQPPAATSIQRPAATAGAREPPDPAVAPAPRAQPPKGGPTSLLPAGKNVGPGPGGRTIDPRHSAALNSLSSRPAAAASPRFGLAIAATDGGFTPAQPTATEEADLTADALNEREHRRHRQSETGESPRPTGQ